MISTSKETQAKDEILSDDQVFQVLEEASSQYEKYLELRSYGYEANQQQQYAHIKRDINYPLTIVIR